MGKRLINVDEVEEIIPVLVGKLLENNLITEKQADQIIRAIFNDNCLGEYGERDVHQDVETMANEEYNKWLILYFDMQSINLQFNCNDIASSLKAQRDKIKQFCIDCLTGVKHQADSFLFDTNACIFSTSETRELLFSHEEYLILEADTTKGYYQVEEPEFLKFYNCHLEMIK